MRKICTILSYEAKGTNLAGTHDTMLTLPVEQSLTPIENGGENASKYVCAICLNSIWTKKFGSCDPCGHVLHQSCFCEWAMTKKTFFSPKEEQQQTKCPVCNTGVHKMQNIYWTCGSIGQDIDGEKVEEEEHSDDCSYFTYLEKRVQEETAAIKVRISMLEEQGKIEGNRIEGLSKTVAVLKNQVATLNEDVEQNRHNLKRLRETMEQVLAKFGLNGMLHSGASTVGESVAK